MRILAIKRKGDFSPNHIGNDAAILDAVCGLLGTEGQRVEVIGEEDYGYTDGVVYDLVVTMGRSKSLLSQLQHLEDQGLPIINSAYGIEHCFRKNMTQLLLANGILYPRSVVVDTNSHIMPVVEQLGGEGVWIKRGDFHAIHKEDVTFASSIEQAQSILSEYALRGIEDAVVSEHLTGDLLKFYAVRGTAFFYWFYPYEHNHHKYAVYEQINGKTLHYPFDLDKLKQQADHAAAVLGVDIYGGDAIIGPDGTFHIIDLNDWPSFAPCRTQASEAIAYFLLNHFKPTYTYESKDKSTERRG